MPEIDNIVLYQWRWLFSNL